MKEQFDAQKPQLFLWVPIVFACGVGLYFSLPFEPLFSLSLFCFVLAAALYGVGHGFGTIISRIFIIFALFTGGFAAASYRTHSVKTPILVKKIGAATIIGDVLEIEKLDEGDGSRLILGNLEIEDFDASETPRRVRLTLRKDDGVRAGQRVRVLAGLNPPSGPLIPGGFNFRRYLYFQGVGAVGFIYNPPEIIEETSHAGFIEVMRQRVEARIYSVLPTRKAAIAAALLVGKKNAINDDDRQAVRDAGLAHMLAISGLHVGIFSGTLFFILRFLMASVPALALKYPIKKVAAVIALSCAVFYMFLAGCTIPTQRAVLMIGFVFLAIILDRSPVSLRLVATAALIVLIFRPESLLSVSFQMSFAAVTCLIYFYDLVCRYLKDTYKDGGVLRTLGLYFLGICLTTLIASIATAPFALYHFGQVSFMGSFANFVAVPLLAFIIMPFALLALVLMPFGLDGIALHVVGYGIQGMLEISYLAANLPYAIILNAMWPFGAFIAIILSCLFMMLWRGWGKVIALPFLVGGMIVSQCYVMPDVLVDASHKLFAFRDGSTLYTSTRRSGRFVLENWEKLYGLPEKSAVLLDYKGGRSDQCGEQGCRFEINGSKVSFVRAPYILKEECAWADLVVSVEPLPRDMNCAARFIDKFDTWENGTYAVWLRDDGIRMRATGAEQTGRPWDE